MIENEEGFLRESRRDWEKLGGEGVGELGKERVVEFGGGGIWWWWNLVVVEFGGGGIGWLGELIY